MEETSIADGVLGSGRLGCGEGWQHVQQAEALGVGLLTVPDCPVDAEATADRCRGPSSIPTMWLLAAAISVCRSIA